MVGSSTTLVSRLPPAQPNTNTTTTNATSPPSTSPRSALPPPPSAIAVSLRLCLSSVDGQREGAPLVPGSGCIAFMADNEKAPAQGRGFGRVLRTKFRPSQAARPYSPILFLYCHRTTSGPTP